MLKSLFKFTQSKPISKSLSLNHPYILTQFSSSRLTGKCHERRRLFTHFKNLYHNNIKHVAKLVLELDLKYTAIVAENYNLLNLNDEELKENILTSVNARINDLNPEIAYELAYSLQELVEKDSADIYKSIYGFICANFFYFTYDQLVHLEKVFYVVSKRIKFDFSPIFKNFLQYTKNEVNRDIKEKSKVMIKHNHIIVPKNEIELYFVSSRKNIVHVKFKKSNKMLTLVGMSKNNIDSIIKAREILDQKDYDIYMLDNPPLTRQTFNEKRYIQKVDDYQMKIQRIIGEDFLNMSKHGNNVSGENKADVLNFFDKYDCLPYINREQCSWYIDNILKNPDYYKIKDAESVVYKNHQGLVKPYDIGTIIYLLSKKKHDFTILFTGMQPFDEINDIITGMPEQDCKELYQYARSYRFNETTNWVLRVNKQGCPMCSKILKDIPKEINDIASRKLLNFNIGEQYMADQILRAINLSNGMNYVYFCGEEHIISVLRKICIAYKDEIKLKQWENLNEEAEKMTKEEKFKSFIKYDCEKMVFKDEKERESYTNKLALLSSFYHDHNEIRIPDSIDIDNKLYQDLLTLYKRMLKPETFTENNEQKWKVQNAEERCFAVDFLFHK